MGMGRHGRGGVEGREDSGSRPHCAGSWISWDVSLSFSGPDLCWLER